MLCTERNFPLRVSFYVLASYIQRVLSNHVSRIKSVAPKGIQNTPTAESVDAFSFLLVLFSYFCRRLDSLAGLLRFFHNATRPEHERRDSFLFLLFGYLDQRPILSFQSDDFLQQWQNQQTKSISIST